MKNSRSRNQKFMLIAFICTLLFHSAAISSLQGMKVNFETSNHAYMENQLAKNKESPRKDESKLIKERNVQLSEVFLELNREKDDIEAPKFNLPTRSEEVLCTEISTEETTELTFMEDHQQSSDEFFIEPLENNESYTAEEGAERCLDSDEDTFNVNLPAEISQLFACEENQISAELIQATEGLHGEVICENINTITDAPSLTIGTLQGSESESTNFDNRSGILDEGGFDKYISNDSNLVPQELIASYDDSDLIAYTNEEISISRRTAPIESTMEQPYSPSHPLSAKDNATRPGHIASSEDFDISFEYTPREGEDGYLFRLELTSKKGVKFKKIKQNVIFLIDRSHSISKARFDATKTAVLNALGELSPEDTFNIMIFDKSITRLSHFNLPYKPENLKLAKDFLDNENHGGMFASTELYTSLGSIVPKVVAENEVNTAILLSDGDTYLMSNKQRKAIRNWTNENKGKISLYCLATGTNNNFPLLDVISVFNKGSLYVADNNQHLVKALTQLMKDIKNPIGKNILVTAISKDRNADISISPPQNRLPNLYENKKYTLYGSTNSLEDFYIFFQGRYYNKRINIKNLISFDRGRKVTSNEIKKLWALQEAYRMYDLYLLSGNLDHVEKARALLEKYNIPVAFN